MISGTDFAKNRLESAHNAVASAASALTEIRGLRVSDGVVVNLADWKELQEALGEWRAATEAFLSAVNFAGKDPEIGDILAK